MKFFLDREKRNGFTLIELMFVIAVIGIVAMVTMPKYQGVKSHYQLDASAQRVVDELRYAKQLAIDKRTNVAIEFGTGFVRLYYITLDTTSTPPIIKTAAPVKDAVTYNPGVSFSNSMGLYSGLNGNPFVYYDYTGMIGANHDAALDPKYAAALELKTISEKVTIYISTGTGYVTSMW